MQAPIRSRALRPDPIVSRSRGGSGRMLPRAPELPEPSALRRLPAGRPIHPPYLPVLPPWELPDRRRSPGTRASLPPSHRARAAAAAAGAAETITGGGSCGGAGNGPGGAGRRVPPRPFSGSALGRLLEEWSTQNRADRGVRNEGGLVGSGRGAGSWGAAGKEKSRERRGSERTVGAARGSPRGGLEAGRIADEG